MGKWELKPEFRVSVIFKAPYDWQFLHLIMPLYTRSSLPLKITSKPGTPAVLTPGEAEAGGPLEPNHELKISLGSTVKFPLSDQSKTKQNKSQQKLLRKSRSRIK